MKCTNTGRQGKTGTHRGFTTFLQSRFGTVGLLVVPKTEDVEKSMFFNGCRSSGSPVQMDAHGRNEQMDRTIEQIFVEWAENEIAVVPDFHKRILFSDEAHFWLKGYVNKQNGRIWSEANPQMYVETPLHPEKLTVWCVLWAGGILLQK
ncbi:hypothetical protein TNCV_3086361 [Trichonephila clavipes]|nr:hypothetical protein TNCV_3086361 [Trichonephila clavipes]